VGGNGNVGPGGLDRVAANVALARRHNVTDCTVESDQYIFAVTMGGIPHPTINAPTKIRTHQRISLAGRCREQGAEDQQIQLLLGHASIQTTERYLGTRQDLEHAPNDRLGLSWRDE
jgi:hypothetical protein